MLLKLVNTWLCENQKGELFETVQIVSPMVGTWDSLSGRYGALSRNVQQEIAILN